MIASPGTACITGASAGIGRAYADRLARRGYDLILVARRRDALEIAAADLQSRYGVNVSFIVADLRLASDQSSVATRVSSDESLTMLVNNAGNAKLSTSLAVGDGDIADMIDLNARALERLTLSVLPGFVKRDRGTIVNIASVLGLSGLPNSTTYSATKAFVITFTRGLQLEFADANIAIQLVLPGATATDLWESAGVPLSALDPAMVMTAEDCVDAALAGLDMNESTSIPSLEDSTLLETYEAARLALFLGARSGTPASRYRNLVTVKD
jgi:short-subunit dehydrogenase